MIKTIKLQRRQDPIIKWYSTQEGRCVWGDDEISIGSVPFSSFLLF